MAQIVRLSSVTALEVLGAKAYTPTDKFLYIYQFESGKFKHILNQDSSNNTRDRSIEPYFQNILLKPTPVFYFGDTFHTNAKYNLTHDLNYLSCKLHLANGYAYNPTTTYGIYFRLYFKTSNGGEITLASIIDVYNNSEIVANTRELYLEGVGFSQSIEFDILDIDSIINNPSMSDVKTALLGSNTITSEIMVDFAFIENDQIVDFVQNSNTFQRLYLNDIHTASVFKSDDQTELFVSFKKDDVDKVLRMQVDHSRYNILAYLSQYGTEDELTVDYDLTFEYYDGDDNLVASDAIQLRNLLDPFAEVVYKPFIADDYDHVFIECRGTIININSGLRISRYANVLIASPQVFFGQVPFVLNTTVVKPIHKIEKISRPVVAPNEMPTLVEIFKPIYVETAENDLIVLHQVESNVKILLNNIDTKFSRALVLKIGNRTYTPIDRTQDYVIFKLPESEYFNNDTVWYIMDNSNQMVSFGGIVRFSGANI